MVQGQVYPSHIMLQLYISGSWRGSFTLDDVTQTPNSGIAFFDGTNMRLQNTTNETSKTIWYQKF